MTALILKIKENEQVCNFCEAISFVTALTLPIAIPFFVIYAATLN